MKMPLIEMVWWSRFKTWLKTEWAR